MLSSNNPLLPSITSKEIEKNSIHMLVSCTDNPTYYQMMGFSSNPYWIGRFLFKDISTNLIRVKPLKFRGIVAF